MHSSVIDLPALLLAVAIAALITGVLLFAHRGDNHRRGWLTALALAGGLTLIGVLDLATHSPRQTQFATVIIGAILPVLGALGMIRGTRHVTPWIRATLIFATTLVLLFAGLLISATLFTRILPF